jgi:antitoxin MazE
MSYHAQKTIDLDVYTMYTHTMRTTIRRWGNSLAIRIPKVFALQLGILSGEEVDVSLDAGSLRITSAARNLDALLAEVTPENIHGETLDDDLRGKEIW